MFEVGCESGYGTSCDANTNWRLDLADSATSIAWAWITSKPTTVAGYAITDAVDLTSSQIITGAKYFQSNKWATSYLGANTTYGLEAYSTDGGAAAMSFHRAGSWAINLGLDPDNVFRLGWWSAPSARWQVDMSGNETVAWSMTAGAWVRALGGSVFNLTNGYSFSGVGDTDGGIFSPADGTVVLATNNAERLRVDSVGNIGIGTSTGTNRLTVSGNVNLGNIGSTTTYNNGYLVFGGSGTNNYGTDLGYSNARFSTRLFAPTTADITFGTIPALTLPTLQSQFTTLMTIRGDTGNVGIWTSTPVAKLAVNSLGLISFANNAAYDIGAGRIAAGQSIYSYGRICAGAASGDCTGGGGFLADSAGTVTATNYYYNSDRNLKTNIKVISSPLEKIMSLNGYTFDWKSTGKPGLGVIAQEVEKVFPELVAESKNASGSTIKSVQYGNLVAPIIEAIKELATTVKSNNADIVALRSENEILKKRLDAIDARLTR